MRPAIRPPSAVAQIANEIDEWVAPHVTLAVQMKLSNAQSNRISECEEYLGRNRPSKYADMPCLWPPLLSNFCVVRSGGLRLSRAEDWRVPGSRPTASRDSHVGVKAESERF
jgi:hypothetical protein